MHEQSLVEALKRQDPEAVQELVTTFGDRLLRSAYLLCGNEGDAEDLVQETFVEAIGSFHRFRGGSGPYTWVHAILLNLTRHYHRDRKRMVHDESLVEQAVVEREPGSANPLDLESASAALTAALGQLSNEHREVLVLRFYEDMKLEEIARQLGISKGTVKSRLHYATAQMQRLMPAEMNLFGPEGTKEMLRP